MAGSMTFATDAENEAFDKGYNDGFEEGKKAALEKQVESTSPLCAPDPPRQQALYMAIDFTSRSNTELPWTADQVVEAAKTFEEYIKEDSK